MIIMDLINKEKVNEVVEIHMLSFAGFFLTFLGRGFLKQLYKGFIEHTGSGLIVAMNEKNSVIGFLAYSDNISDFYKYLIKRKLVPFAWYAGCAFLCKPKILLRLLRAFSYAKATLKAERYIELSSIGVLPTAGRLGLGSKMICYLKNKADKDKYEYIKLETDAVNNDNINNFYKKNNFKLVCEYSTHEGRRMNEYRFFLKEDQSDD